MWWIIKMLDQYHFSVILDFVGNLGDILKFQTMSLDTYIVTINKLSGDTYFTWHDPREKIIYYMQLRSHIDITPIRNTIRPTIEFTIHYKNTRKNAIFEDLYLQVSKYITNLVYWEDMHDKSDTMSELTIPGFVNILYPWVTDFRKVKVRFMPSITSIRNGFMSSADKLEVVDIGYNLPNLRHIGYSFLSDSRSLISLDLRGSTKLESIGMNFLRGACRMEKLELPPRSKIVKIERGFLSGTQMLQSVDLSMLSNVVDIDNSFMTLCSSVIKLDLSGLCKLRVIGDSFLAGCRRLESVTFPVLEDTITIRHSFMSDCKIKELDMRSFKNVELVGGGFLNGCSELKDLKLFPLYTGNILSSMFLYNCEKLEKIILPNMPEVVRIADNVFAGCKSLQSIDLSCIPRLSRIGECFLAKTAISALDLKFAQSLDFIGDNFVSFCKELKTIDLTGLQKLSQIGADFGNKSHNLKSIIYILPTDLKYKKTLINSPTYKMLVNFLGSSPMATKEIALIESMSDLEE